MDEATTTPLTFMAVHAHPDDEVFGTGGTLARLAAEGVKTVLVTCTGGELGEIVDPDLDEAARAETFKHLGEVRAIELKNSAAALNVSELKLLGFHDSGMAGTEGNKLPESFHRATFDEAVRRLVKLIREYKPQVLASYDPFGGYGHPDHLQAHRITVAAFEAAGEPRLFAELDLPAWQPGKLYYTAISREFFQRTAAEMRARGIDGPWNNPEMETDEWGIPESEITTVFDVRDYVENKMQAFRAHKTQIAPNNFMFIIPEERRREGLGYEQFILARTKGLAPALFAENGKEQDLFAGYR